MQQKVTYANGDSYTGQLQGGKPHGQGVMTETDGTKYEGNFKGGERDGEGILTYQNGTKYEGNFKGDLKCGKGVMTYANGGSDSGEFKYDRLNGKGVRKYANGDSYEGEFFAGERDGTGVMKYASGACYNGEFKDNRIFVDVKKPKKQNETKTVVFQSSKVERVEHEQWKYDAFTNEHLIERHDNIETKEEAIAELNVLAGVNGGESTKFKLVFDQHGGEQGWNDIGVDTESAEQMLKMLYSKGYRDITVSDLSCHGGTASHFKEISQEFVDKNPDINVTIRASVEGRIVIPCNSNNGTKFRTFSTDGEALNREKSVYDAYDEGERKNAGCLAQKLLNPSYKKLKPNQNNQSTDCNRIGL